MSDSEEEDEEVQQQQLSDQISTEAKAKEEEIKRFKESQLPITQRVQIQLKEGVHKVTKVVTEHATMENIKVVNDKVKGVFGSAFTKFNDIVEKNKANIPQININDILAQNDLLMT